MKSKSSKKKGLLWSENLSLKQETSWMFIHINMEESRGITISNIID